jgi:hypothetical protein
MVRTNRCCLIWGIVVLNSTNGSGVVWSRVLCMVLRCL